MNFKDAYKSYNDEIKSNPDVLKAILETKHEPKYSFNFPSVLAFAATLAFVVSVSFFSYNHFQKNQEPTVRYIAANSNKNTDSSESDTMKNKALKSEESVALADNTAKSEMSGNESNADKNVRKSLSANNSGIAVSEKSAPANNKGNVASESKMHFTDEDNRAAESVSLSENEVTYNKLPAKPLNENNSQNPNEILTPARMILPDDKQVNNTALPDNGKDVTAVQASAPDGDICSDVVPPAEPTSPNCVTADDTMPATIADEGIPAVAVGDEEVEEYMSYNEYKDYIGFDIQAKAKLPNDMIFEPMPSATVEYENDELVSDMFTASAFSTENPERNLSISVTKKGPYAGRFSEDTGYAYKDNPSEIIGAYVEVDGVSVSIGVNNITKEEVDTFINSLK